MYQDVVGLLDATDLSDNTKQILAQLLGQCQQPLSTNGPVTIDGPVTLNGPTNITNDFTINNQTIQQIIQNNPGGPASVNFAVAQSGHVLQHSAMSTGHFVSVRKCTDITGTGQTGSAFNLLLPSPNPALEPNVQKGAVLGYVSDASANPICVTGYLDKARGTIAIWFGLASSIPAGWALCDGTGYTNNGLAFTTPDLRDRFVIGAGNLYSVGTTGGNTTHTHAAHQPAATSTVSLSVTITPSGSPTVSGMTDTTPLTATSTYVDESGFTTGFTDEVSLSGTAGTGTCSIQLGQLSGIITGGSGSGSITITGGSGSGTCSTNSTSWTPSGLDVVLYGTVMCGGVTAGGDFQAFDCPNAQVTEPVTGTTTIPSLSGTVSINSLSGSGTCTVNMLSGSVSIPAAGTVNGTTSGGSVTITPDPHSHVYNEPVYGVEVTTTISPNPHRHTFTNQPISGLTFTAGLVTPDPHFHMTPILTHDTQSHLNPFFALCYIMRVN